MRKIRGNHVAVVPRGRAGSEVGIKDAHPEIRRVTMPKTNVSRFLRAVGFQAWAKDAKPEEVADALEGMDDEDKVAKEAAEKEDAARDKKGGKDKKSAKDEMKHDPDDEDCECKDCMGAKDKAKDSAKLPKDEEGDDEMTDADKLEEDEKKDKKEEKKEAAEDADALILPADEHSKSEFSTGDAAKHLLTLKPVIAACKSKGAKDAYNALCKGVRQVKSGIKDGATDPFALLTRISSADGAADNEAEIPMFQF